MLIKSGDELHFRVIDREWTVVVRDVNENPTSLREARLMYVETAGSREKHVQSVEFNRVSLHRISLQSAIQPLRTEPTDYVMHFRMPFHR